MSFDFVSFILSSLSFFPITIIPSWPHNQLQHSSMQRANPSPEFSSQRSKANAIDLQLPIHQSSSLAPHHSYPLKRVALTHWPSTKGGFVYMARLRRVRERPSAVRGQVSWMLCRALRTHMCGFVSTWSLDLLFAMALHQECYLFCETCWYLSAR